MKIRVCAVLLLLVASAAAQFDGNVIMIRRVRIRLTFVSGGCEVDTHVVLVGNNGRVGESVANDECFVDFLNVPEGTYQLDISGPNVTNPSGAILYASMGSDEFEVKVDRSGRTLHGDAARPSVSVTGLNVPVKARKDFDKANDSIRKEDFAKAIESLNRAVTAYPAYAEAYNSLGVSYARLGDPVHEEEALQNAIKADDHFAPAYVNLARMNIRSSDFPSAESRLNKAASLDPTDALTFVLLSYSELMNRHFDLAIVSAKHAHTLSGGHAYAHQIAARAYEQKRDGAGAVAELELFLKEEPTGARADGARKELLTLHSLLSSLPSAGASQ